MVVALPTLTVRPPDVEPPVDLVSDKKPAAWWDDMPTEPSGKTLTPTSAPTVTAPAESTSPAKGKAWWDDMPTEKPPPEPPPREVGSGEAFGAGAINTLSFGLAPQEMGLQEAGRVAAQRFAKEHGLSLEHMPRAILELIGASVEANNWIRNHDDPEITEAHERGRKAALETLDLSREQHPIPYWTGVIGAGLATPVPGLGAATMPVRIARGVVTGGALGGAQAGGEAISRGEDWGDVAQSAAHGALAGQITGGVLHGALGPRVPVPALERAAATSSQLGAPLGRGFTSPSKIVRGVTAGLQQLPFTGGTLRRNVQGAAEAAGERIEEIGGQMAGGTSRTTADTAVRRGIESMIQRNKLEGDAHYGNLRQMLLGGGDAQGHKMPYTKAALDKIVKQRWAKGSRGAPGTRGDPERGLEKFRALQDDASFNGAQALRSEAGTTQSKELYAAMTRDLHNIAADAASAAGNNPRDAIRAFQAADARYGELMDMNEILRGIGGTGREGAIARATSAAKEIGGDARLLQEMRRHMPAQAFQHVGAQILNELGTGREGEFSLPLFVKGWDKLSEPAKRALFSPPHLRDINEIVDMAGTIAKSLKAAESGGHATGPLVMFEVLKTIGELAIGYGAGVVTGHEIAQAGGVAAASQTLTYLLSKPAATASTRAWMRAWGNFLKENTPARAAAFKTATRNLGNTLGVSQDAINAAVQRAQQPPADNKRPEVPIR